MPLVLDASVAVCWALQDEQSAVADEVEQKLLDDFALVPSFWWFEVRSALLQAERRQRLDASQSAERLLWLSVLPARAASRPSDDNLFTCARRWKLSVYDAAYLELAQRAGLPLATLDHRLAEAARAAGVALL